MTGLQKGFGLLVGVAALTTAILPGRQTVPVINAITNLLKGTFGTVMGTAKPA